jgi:sirohydrochlorin cobaltochelatase
VRVILAFLETMQPTLDEAVATLVSEGCAAIRIAPIFFGQGGHVRDDLPRLVTALQAKHSTVVITSLQPAGESASVQGAIAAFCIEGL